MSGVQVPSPTPSETKVVGATPAAFSLAQAVASMQSYQRVGEIRASTYRRSPRCSSRVRNPAGGVSHWRAVSRRGRPPGWPVPRATPSSGRTGWRSDASRIDCPGDAACSPRHSFDFWSKNAASTRPSSLSMYMPFHAVLQPVVLRPGLCNRSMADGTPFRLRGSPAGPR